MSIAAIRTWSELFLQEKKDCINKKLEKAKTEEERQQLSEKLEKQINALDFNILEALAATGLRSCRYAKEIQI
ncbi:unnamed protein product [Cunninghamella echinulata]